MDGMEPDPVADFLQREKTDLADIEDNGFGSGDALVFATGNNQPVVEDEGEDEFTMLGGGTQPNSVDEISNVASDPVFGHAVEQQEQQNAFFEEAPTAAPAVNGYVNGFDEAAAAQPAAPAFVAQSLPKIEPEKIRRWREEQKGRLEKKDEEEEKEKAKLREQGKRELEEWYKNRVDLMDKTKKNNRVAEQQFVKDRDSEQPGQEWERITRLCEFNPKAAKNTKDVSRLRSILLQLKQQPLVKTTS